MESTHRALKFLQRWTFVTALGLALVPWFPGLAVIHAAVASGRGSLQPSPYGCCEHTMPVKRVADNGHGDHGKTYRRLPPEDKARIQRNLREWQSLPPETQQKLRHRMDQLKELPPEDRTLYQKRFNQLQQLPPGERERVREKLENWNSLSPNDKEEIRRKFPSQ